jgi:hypothetical protein
MNNIDAKNFLFTLLKVKNGVETLDTSIKEAEARLSESDIKHVEKKLEELKKQ